MLIFNLKCLRKAGDVSGVNSRILLGKGGFFIARSVNARATNTRVASDRVNTIWRFNTD